MQKFKVTKAGTEKNLIVMSYGYSLPQFRKIQARVLRENPSDGMRTIAIDGSEARRLEALIYELTGISIFDTARNGKFNAHGQYTFRAGGGYNIFDADLLGGDGDGTRTRELAGATGIWFTY